MERQFKGAVFDLDGTLLDTSEGIKSAVRFAIDRFGLEPLSDERLNRFIGPPIQNSFAAAYGLTGQKLRELTEVFRDRYKSCDLLKAKPYEGIYDVFRTLLENGIKPAVATYKRQDYASEILIHFGFDKYTDIMYGADSDNKLKKKDIIEKALIDMGISNYSEAVMIGDTDNDAIGAAEIGTKFIGVTYGFGFKNAQDVSKFPNIGAAGSTSELTKILIGGNLA